MRGLKWWIPVFVVLVPTPAFCVNALTPTINNLSTNNQTYRTPGGSFDQRLNVGGGYYIPNLPGGKDEIGSIQTNLGGGLDCSGLNWASEFKNALNLDLAQSDLNAAGANALAGAAKYVANSLMPTWAETLQQALQNAKAKLNMLKQDCNAISQQLSQTDPLGVAALRQKADTIKKEDKNGMGPGQAISDIATKGVDWSLYGSIDDSGMSDKSKQTLKAFLGDVSFKGGGDQQNTGQYEILQPDNIDMAYLAVVREVKTNIWLRMTGQGDENCADQLFASRFGKNGLTSVANTVSGTKPSGSSQKQDQAKALEQLLMAATDRSVKVAVLTEYEIFKINPTTSQCGALLYYNQYDSDTLPIILDRVAQDITLQGMAKVINTLTTELDTLQMASSNPELVKMATQTRDAARNEFEAIQRIVKKDQDTRENLLRSATRTKEANKASRQRAVQMMRYNGSTQF